MMIGPFSLFFRYNYYSFLGWIYNNFLYKILLYKKAAAKIRFFLYKSTIVFYKMIENLLPQLKKITYFCTPKIQR